MSKERPEGRLCFLLKQVLPFFFGQLLWFENHDELLEGAREGKRHFVHVVLYHRSSGVPTFLTSLPEFPFQQGSSLNTANINYELNPSDGGDETLAAAGEFYVAPRLNHRIQKGAPIRDPFFGCRDKRRSRRKGFESPVLQA